MIGEQIKLRAVEPSDLSVLYDWENDPKNWEVSGTIAPFSRYILEQYILNSANDIYTNKQLRFIITTTEEVAIGTIDLFDFDPQHARAGIGILIGDTAHRRKGLAKKALLELIKYAKETLQLHQLYCNINNKNIASINLFEKAGFKLIGIKKQWQRTKNGFEDEAMYQLIL